MPHLSAPLPFAQFSIATDGSIISANPLANQLLKTTENQLAGSNISAWFDESSDILRFVQDALTHGSMTKAYDHTILLADGSFHKGNIYVVTDDSNHAHLTIDIILGATQISAQQQKDKLTDRLGLMGAMLAHEIKNPLSAIRGAAQLMAEDAEDIGDENNTALTNIIINEVDRITHTLGQVEFLSHDNRLQPTACNIHEILHYAVDVLDPALKHNLTINQQFDPSLPPVSGDREQLIQLLVNLIKNACEALNTAEQSAPTLTLSTAYQHSYRLSYRDQTPLAIAITITDNAGGIAPNVVSKLFDPLTSTKRDGNGLGLSIAAKITRDHGGIIELSENSPEQTSFSVLLPMWKS